MKKYLIVLFLLQGCSSNESMYYKVYSNVEAICPNSCLENKEIWTGLVKLYPSRLKCICKVPNSCLVTD